MKTPLRIAALAGLCMACACAAASPITYDFTVTAFDGPLAGTVAHGDFTFDSSSITPGAQNTGPGLFTSLHFTWNAIVYTAATANTGTLTFDATGTLVDVIFGTQCVGGSCSGTAGTEGWTVGTPLFFYTTSGTDIGFTGSASFSLATVPEPAGLALFAAALATLALVRRRARGSS